MNGRHTYVTQLQGVCASVCRLESIALSWPGPEGATGDQQAAPTTIAVVIEHIDEQAGGRFRPVIAGLTQPRALASITERARESLVASQPRPLVSSSDSRTLSAKPSPPSPPPTRPSPSLRS